MKELSPEELEELGAEKRDIDNRYKQEQQKILD